MNKAIRIEELMPYLHGNTLSAMAQALVEQQIAVWDLPGRNYAALQTVESRDLNVNGFLFRVQYNPSRIVSSAAKVDVKSISERKCFLCSQHLPEMQKGIPFGNDYLVLVNPFPIFDRHLTIPAFSHTDQRISGRLGVMLDLAEELKDFVLFYNGPKCGASAPDHMHFQAGNKGFLPLETDWQIIREQAEIISERNDVTVSRLPYYLTALVVLESTERAAITAEFEKIHSLLIVNETDAEPMMNLLCRFDDGVWTLWIFPRRLHRPRQYFAGGDDNLLISPASVDLGGVFITPLEKDFNKLSEVDIADILGQISYGPEDFDRLCDQLSD
jgi:hypothetical protein